jgi:N-acetylglucosaminyl-diphospho-decaprenol L-rhamnosyltransferase
MACSVSVVTVTYNSAHIVNAALSPFSPEHEIICVDNASSDDLSAALEGVSVSLIQNPENVGFGRACNQGLSAASGEFVLFINPDVRVDDSTLPALLDAARRYPDSGVFLPMTRRDDGRLWLRNRPAGPGPRGRSREDLNQIEGDFCSQFMDGSIFLVRRSLFRDMGGFDENIFLYYEDDDLSRRLLSRKSPIIVVKDAFATHAAGKSVSGGWRVEVNRNKYKKISEIYYFNKHCLNYNITADSLSHILKIFFYGLTLDVGRLCGACGRLLGILNHLTERR